VNRTDLLAITMNKIEVYSIYDFGLRLDESRNECERDAREEMHVSQGKLFR